MQEFAAAEWSTGPSGAHCLLSKLQPGPILHGSGSPVQLRGCLCRINLPASSPSLLSQLSCLLLHPAIPCCSSAGRCGKSKARVQLTGTGETFRDTRKDSGTTGDECYRVTRSKDTFGVRWPARVRPYELGRALGDLQLPAWPSSSQVSGHPCWVAVLGRALPAVPLKETGPKGTTLCFRDILKGGAESFRRGRGEGVRPLMILWEGMTEMWVNNSSEGALG